MSTGQNSPKKKKDTGNAAFSPRFPELVDALEALYITGNLSGRIKFREAWPLAAERIFGSELMKFDAEGTKDKDRRAELEQEAEMNRQSLLTELAEIKEKSLKNSMLELDYIKETMKRLGRDFAVWIYAENLVEKFLPVAPAAPQATPVAAKAGGIAAPIDASVEDLPDDLAPIDAGSSQLPPQAAPQPAMPQQASSPLNLGKRRQVLQVDHVRTQPVSYDELLQLAENEESASGPGEQQQPQLQPQVSAIDLKAVFNGCAVGAAAVKQ